MGTNEDTNLHCYIVRCTAGKCEFWDLETQLNIPKNNLVTNEDFGKVVIGKTLRVTDIYDLGKGGFSELILFQEPVSDEALDNIRNFLKTHYSFKEIQIHKSQVPKEVVNDKVLNNLV